jgi:hypothetical protein
MSDDLTRAIRDRERCAKLIELIAADWREAGADHRVWACEYLARQIRETAAHGQSTTTEK